MLDANPPPPPLPSGWFLKPSLSSPSDHYYFNHDSGECRWEYPIASALGTGQSTSTAPVGAVGAAAVSQESLNATAAAAAAAVKSILKRSNSGTTTEEGGGGLDPTTTTTTTTTTASHHKKQSPSSRKRVKTNGDVRERKEKEHRGGGSSSRESARSSSSSRHHHHEGRLSSSSSSSDPKEVRVLHILKKHRGSRRPASWRNPKITDSKEKAVADLRELISILESSSAGGNHKEVRATFEELARTESDCSSAKKGGDLGFFGRKKMQPAFEKASFRLRVGQLSDIVDTSSGVHVILRLA